MKSLTEPEFWRLLNHLPANIRDQANAAFRLFVKDPFHPSLHFKQVDAMKNVWSVRIGMGYRALGTRTGNAIIWSWIGSHAEYDRLV